VLLAGLTAAAFGACGGGERQDENEPEGTFKVDVTRASFPAEQTLAKVSEVRITVRNVDTKDVPNVAVTLNGLDVRLDDASLADPSRPQFVINAVPTNIGGFPEAKEAGPKGGETAYVNTWALGELKPNESKTFVWKVTAVRAGKYKLAYEVSGGLNGKAKAVDASGKQPKGSFTGEVSKEPPKTRVADDGKTVVEDTR
jgi:hypothetical protein